MKCVLYMFIHDPCTTYHCSYYLYISYHWSNYKCICALSIVYLVTIVCESFKDYIAVEMLEGENKYDAEKFGLQVSLLLL